MLGNFLGDFVKGSSFEHLPDHIQSGVRLHRAVDSFTDAHPIIQNLRTAFPTDLRRMSGVIIDIYFDHLLCTHWQRFNSQALEVVLNAFYNEVADTNVPVEGRFVAVKQGLLNYRWLADYQHRDGCIRAYFQIEKRLNHKITFAEKANRFLLSHHDVFETAFLEFYPHVIEHSQNQTKA
jgi:acyl carrier protein phosphodiesterase